MRKLALAALALLAIDGWEGYAAAQTPPQPACGPSDKMLSFLIDKYQENLVIRGVTGRGSKMVLMGNHKTRTWTLLEIHPNGMACAVAAGDDLTTVAQGSDS